MNLLIVLFSLWDDSALIITKSHPIASKSTIKLKLWLQWESSNFYKLNTHISLLSVCSRYKYYYVTSIISSESTEKPYDLYG